MEWPKKGQKDKQRSTKHYTENQKLSNTDPTKNQGEIGCLRIPINFLSTVINTGIIKLQIFSVIGEKDCSSATSGLRYYS